MDSTTKFITYVKKHPLLVVLDFQLIALFFSPYSMTRTVISTNGQTNVAWDYHPVYSDEIMLLGYAPIAILTLVFQSAKRKFIRKAALTINVVISFFLTANALFAIPFLDGDGYIPHVGTYLLITIFLNLLIIFIVDEKVNQNKKTKEPDMLDEAME